MFLLDLLSGVIFFQYGKELDQDSRLSALSCSQEQINWIMIQQLLRNVKPSFTFLKKPKNKVREIFFRFTTKPFFSLAMYLVIVADILRLALGHADMSDDWQAALDAANFACTSAFILEALARVVAHKKRVFRNKWTYIELLVLTCSIFF